MDEDITDALVIVSAVPEGDGSDQLAEESEASPVQPPESTGENGAQYKAPSKYYWWEFKVKGGAICELIVNGEPVRVSGSLSALWQLGVKLGNFDPSNQV